MHLGSRQFDVVVSDINMPNLDGLKLVEIMVQKGLATPVVFLTAETSEDVEASCRRLGAEDWFGPSWPGESPPSRDLPLQALFGS